MTLEYLGEYRPDVEADRPSFGLLLSGWVHQASADVAQGPKDWRVRLGADLEARLLCWAEDVEFLAACRADAAECWVSGRLYHFEGALRLRPELYTVFGTRGPVALSAEVATAMVRSAAAWELQQAFNFAEPACLTVAPPGAAAMLASALEPHELAAALFAAHAEEVTRARASLHFGTEAVRLGASQQHLHRDGRVTSEPPRLLPAEVVRGCLLMGDAHSLLRVARAALLRPPSTVGGRGTLALALREHLPFVEQALEGLDFETVTRAEEYHPGLRNVLMCAELLQELDASAPALLRSWCRLLTVGWPFFADLLVATKPDFEFHLALAVDDDFDEPPDVAAAAQLLGLSEAGLFDPALLRGALQPRLLRLEEQEAPERAFDYVVRSLEQGAPHGAAHGAARRRLLGPLCGVQQAAFRPLPEGRSVLQHFRPRGTDAFATASLRPDEAPRECPVCFEPGAPVATRCGHWFCEVCLELALASQSRCPACRRGLHRQRDIVHTRPEASAPSGFMRQLLELLLAEKARGARCLVVSRFGELHERLASWLRAQGCARTWAWRGNGRQLLRNLRGFRRSSDGALLLDPEALSLAWASFHVHRVFVVLPLADPGEEGGGLCCRLRELAAALRPGPDFVFLSPDGQPDPQLHCAHGGEPRCTWTRRNGA